jgi:hypothetical protein
MMLGSAALNPTYMLIPATMRTAPLCGIISPVKIRHAIQS